MVVVSCVAAIVLSALAALDPSQPPAAISGAITDTTGRGVPGATITVTSEAGAARTTVTNSAGHYRITGLDPGHYAVEASMVGFDTKVTEFALSPGSDAVWSGALLLAPALGDMSIERQVRRFAG